VTISSEKLFFGEKKEYFTIRGVHPYTIYVELAVRVGAKLRCLS